MSFAKWKYLLLLSATFLFSSYRNISVSLQEMSSHSRRGRGGGRGGQQHSSRGGGGGGSSSILSRLETHGNGGGSGTPSTITTTTGAQHHKRRFAGPRSSLPSSHAVREEDWDGDFQMEEDAHGQKRGRSTVVSSSTSATTEIAVRFIVSPRLTVSPTSHPPQISVPSWQGIEEDHLIGWLKRKSRTGFVVRRVSSSLSVWLVNSLLYSAQLNSTELSALLYSPPTLHPAQRCRRRRGGTISSSRWRIRTKRLDCFVSMATPMGSVAGRRWVSLNVDGSMDRWMVAGVDACRGGCRDAMVHDRSS